MVTNTHAIIAIRGLRTLPKKTPVFITENSETDRAETILSVDIYLEYAFPVVSARSG